jgi:hypothetical protein
MNEKFIKFGTIGQELKNAPGSRTETGCIDFIESLLVLYHTKRRRQKRRYDVLGCRTLIENLMNDINRGQYTGAAICTRDSLRFLEVAFLRSLSSVRDPYCRLTLSRDATSPLPC